MLAGVVQFSIAFRWSAMYVGGRKWRALVTERPYCIVRNPLYVGSFLRALSVGCFLKSIVVLSTVVLVISSAERQLKTFFGDAYREYRRRTPGRIPAASQFNTSPLTGYQERRTRPVLKSRLSLAFVLMITVSVTGCAGAGRSHRTGLSEKIIPNFQMVTPDIFRGGRPKGDGIRELARIGIKSIISLESEFLNDAPGEVEKERQIAVSLGLRYIWFPIHPVAGPTIGELRQAVAAIADPQHQPVFVHCDHGNDRAGLVIAAYRIEIHGHSAEDAYLEMLEHGFHEWWLGSWKRTLFRYSDMVRGGAGDGQESRGG